MIERNRFKVLLPIILIFIALNTFILTAGNILLRWKADQGVILYGNIGLFLITLFSFLVAFRGLKNQNPHAFVRSVYGSVMIKLFLCLILAIIYIAIYKASLNKPALFICMGFYAIYTVFEVTALMKLLNSRK